MRRNERGQPRGKHLGHGKKKWAELMFNMRTKIDHSESDLSTNQQLISDLSILKSDTAGTTTLLIKIKHY